MSDQWEVDPPRPGVLTRLLVPQGSPGERPATMAFLLGVLGTAAFVGSIVLDWQQITVTVPRIASQGVSGGESTTVAASLSNVDMLGQVYVIGAIAMLGLLGSVLTRPDQALRMRMAAAGVGVGLAAVVTATTIRMHEAVYGSPDYFFFGGATFAEGLKNSAEIAYEPGLFCAAGTVVLLTAGVWFAGRSAARAPAANPSIAAEQSPPQPGPLPEPAHVAGDGARVAVRSNRADDVVPAGRADDLTVSASEPLDISVTPDAWPRQISG
jgi:hypothetical protein